MGIELLQKIAEVMDFGVDNKKTNYWKKIKKSSQDLYNIWCA